MNEIIKWLCAVFLILHFTSCEKLELKRIMDASTDSLSIKGTTVVVFGTLLDVGEPSVVQHGHCWATHENPVINDFHSELGPINSKSEFHSTLNSIKPGITHFVRSYVYDGQNYTYGDVMNFEITSADIDFRSTPVRKLNAGTIEISSSTTELGSVTFTNHGHCWSQTDPPTIQDNKTAFGIYQSDILFTSEIHNITLGQYYIRGYLEADGVVIYTSTTSYASTIEVETRTIALNNDNSVTADGMILSLGIKPILEHGHCWSKSTSNPNYNSSKTLLGPIIAPGLYSSNIVGLNSGSTYYIRAYASDGTNVYYGDIQSFVAN